MFLTSYWLHHTHHSTLSSIFFQSFCSSLMFFTLTTEISLWYRLKVLIASLQDSRCICGFVSCEDNSTMITPITLSSTLSRMAAKYVGSASGNTASHSSWCELEECYQIQHAQRRSVIERQTQRMSMSASLFVRSLKFKFDKPYTVTNLLNNIRVKLQQLPCHLYMQLESIAANRRPS